MTCRLHDGRRPRLPGGVSRQRGQGPETTLRQGPMFWCSCMIRGSAMLADGISSAPECFHRFCPWVRRSGLDQLSSNVGYSRACAVWRDFAVHPTEQYLELYPFVSSCCVSVLFHRVIAAFLLLDRYFLATFRVVPPHLRATGCCLPVPAAGLPAQPPLVYWHADALRARSEATLRV